MNIIIGKIAKILFNKTTLYIIGVVVLFFLLREGYFRTYKKISFSHPDVKLMVDNLVATREDLEVTQTANDSLNAVINECSESLRNIIEINQANTDSLVKKNRSLSLVNLRNDILLDSFMVVAPCKEEVTVKDGNPFKKNKKQYIFVNCR